MSSFDCVNDGEAVVHDHLPHLDRVGPVVAHVQLDLARREHGPLDRQVLLRHPDPVEPGRVERDEQPDGEREHDERGEAREPGRTAPGDGGGFHQLTSKKPIQPSSANSLTWAWNMYLPVYGKRSSRMPRSPWPWITVSVKSRGSSRVPVG